MNQTVQKFLEFNGKTLMFLGVNGEYLVALKPVCEAIGVDYIQQFKNTQMDPILNQLLCNHTMVAKDGKMRKMTCLPEKWVYGWLFSIQSSSPELIEYKKLCYEVLDNYFHGSMNRKELIQAKAKAENTINKVLNRLSPDDRASYESAVKQKKHAEYKLRITTREEVDEQRELFN
ncbi:MAG TPA: hypothetical protein DCY35_06780 [Prolixibacteraceae bacterium]|nr:hypothetical protein [Prolixibacteraceae bacterium]